jgi:hypothetical protein
MGRQEAVLDAAEDTAMGSTIWENEGGRVAAPSDR